MKNSLKSDAVYQILILDDEISQLQILTNCLEQNKQFVVLQANKPSVALSIAADKIPDLIITDWEMPEMDGIEFIKKLKDNTTTAGIPVMMATGKKITNEDLEIALDAGALDYLRTPFDSVELHARVRSVLEVSLGYKKIEELNAFKNQLISIIGHDLKSPFTSLIGFTNLLIDAWSEKDDNEKLEIISLLNNTATRTYNMLCDLLNWAHAQSNKYNFEPTNFSLNSALDDIYNFYEPQAKQKNIRLIYPEIETLHVFADIDTVKTVLRNIVNNAIKFTFAGGFITISAIKEGNKALVSVSDTGKGIDPKYHGEIFEISKDKIQSGTANERGTGLGLLICKEYITRNGGKIWFESTVGHGTQMYFTLKLAEM